jgi:hypothetical protein
MFREYTEDSVHRLFSDPALVWYSFINTIPVHEVVTCYIAWGGKIRYKCAIIEFLENQPLEIGIYSHPTPRNWVVITDPVKCMEDIPFRGGQGFRYTQELF